MFRGKDSYKNQLYATGFNTKITLRIYVKSRVKC